MTTRREARRIANERRVWDRRRRLAERSPAAAAKYQWDLAMRDVARIRDDEDQDREYLALAEALHEFNMRFARNATTWTPHGRT